MDWRSASAAERVCDWGEGVQCPNERNPIFFMRYSLAIFGAGGHVAGAQDRKQLAQVSIAD
jgi:hypothetical protein